jgi:uncharacterized protein
MRYVALWLSGICIAMFGLQHFFGTESFLLIKDIAWQQPWRFLTAVFAHGGAAHLFSNLFALGLFGLILEGRIGPKRVLLLFLGAGVLVNFFSPYERSLGASGAVYAILGSLVALRPTMVVWVQWMPMPMFIAGIFWLLQDVFGVFYPTGVANLAHISGLFIGLGAGVLWRKQFGDALPFSAGRKKDAVLEKQLDKWEQKHMLRK